ncbi:uncharacterized protein M6B38_146865 [Iris pallida]|uniref:AT3G52170-like helix-turn-helix domain-containing protein n=1 Tax=Iris pallida TaxID=29817 RepID=A0AAX6FAB1_IRIPA|nr:uncharacterized protein M6B38_146865 [Iris pallida]
MQAIVHSGWTGKVFALSRCSDSRDKKTRNRRTKEERKTMVESFIKTYQDLNNGKFPSLSLTHKEVGGSFYTVREIVREIIQDNRVLGPGNRNSKVLNLEDCCEEHREDSFYINNAGHLSIATISQPTDQRREVVCSASTEYRRASEEIIETDKSGVQEFAIHLKDLPIIQVMDGEQHSHDFSNGEHVNSNLVKLGYKEPSAMADENLVGLKEVHDEVQVKGKENPGIYMDDQQILQETVLVTSPIRENMVNGDETGYTSNNMTEETKIPASGNSTPEIAEADGLLETLNSIRGNGSVSDQVQYSACDTEDSLFASTTIKTCNPDNSHVVEDTTIHLDVSKSSVTEVGMADTTSENSSIFNKTEPVKLHSSSKVDETSAESISRPVSQDFPALPQPMLHPDGSDIVTNNTRNASGELLNDGCKGTTRAKPETGRAHGVSNTGIGSNSSGILSEKSSKEPEALQTNPFWDAIGSLITTIVKFWTG